MFKIFCKNTYIKDNSYIKYVNIKLNKEVYLR